MQKLKIIGISGTNGSGKDSLGQILADDYGYFFVTASDLLRDEARSRGWPIERQQLRDISAEWRRKYGLGVLIDKAVEEYKKQNKKYKGLAIANARNPGEVDRVHELKGILVWVDANSKIRYERISSRARDAESKLSFEQFLAEEQEEMQHSGDEATLSMAGVKAKADIFLENNSSLEDFKKDIQKALKL